MRGNILSIPLSDGHIIYGLLDLAGTTPAQRLVIVSHGLAGHPEEFLHVMARNVFNANGYDVLRLYYYSKYPKARTLSECTYALHASDLREVVTAMRGRYPFLAAAGHSSGGLVMLIANPAVNIISLWEPPFSKTYFVPHARKLESENLYAVGRGAEFLIGPALLEESVARTPETCTAWAQDLSAPAQLILSESGRNSPDMKLLYDNLKDPKQLAVVGGADHLFTVGDTAVKLLRQTVKWFHQF
jgi:hypothetical protein